MGLTLFLLGLVYAVLVGVLIAAGTGAITIAVIAGLLFAFQLFTSDKIALFSMGARQVSPAEVPRLPERQKQSLTRGAHPEAPRRR